MYETAIRTTTIADTISSLGLLTPLRLWNEDIFRDAKILQKSDLLFPIKDDMRKKL